MVFSDLVETLAGKYKHCYKEEDRIVHLKRKYFLQYKHTLMKPFSVHFKDLFFFAIVPCQRQIHETPVFSNHATFTVRLLAGIEYGACNIIIHQIQHMFYSPSALRLNNGVNAWHLRLVSLCTCPLYT